MNLTWHCVSKVPAIYAQLQAWICSSSLVRRLHIHLLRCNEHVVAFYQSDLWHAYGACVHTHSHTCVHRDMLAHGCKLTHPHARAGMRRCVHSCTCASTVDCSHIITSLRPSPPHVLLSFRYATTLGPAAQWTVVSSSVNLDKTQRYLAYLCWEAVERSSYFRE